MGGFFKVYRDIFQHEIFKHELDFRLFMLILGNAIYDKNGTTIEGIHVKRGQWIRSYRMLMKDLEYKQNRGYRQYGIATIKRAISRLIKNELITISETECGTLFTVVNYEKYQGFSPAEEQNAERYEEQLRNNYGTTSEQKKESKKINVNDDDIYAPPGFEEATKDERIEKIKTHFSKKAQKIWYSPEEDKAMSDLIKNGVPVETIINGIDLAFERFKPKHSRDRINSFKYCLHTICELHEGSTKPRGEKNAKREVRPGSDQTTDTGYQSGSGYYDQFPDLFA